MVGRCHKAMDGENNCRKKQIAALVDAFRAESHPTISAHTENIPGGLGANNKHLFDRLLAGFLFT